MWIIYDTMSEDEINYAYEDDGTEEYPDTPMPLKCATNGCGKDFMVYNLDEECYECPDCGRIVKLWFRRAYNSDMKNGIKPAFHAYD